MQTLREHRVLSKVCANGLYKKSRTKGASNEMNRFEHGKRAGIENKEYNEDHAGKGTRQRAAAPVYMMTLTVISRQSAVDTADICGA